MYYGIKEVSQISGISIIFTSFNMSEINRHKEKLKRELKTELIMNPTESSCEKTENYSNEEWTVVISKADAILSEIYALMNKGAKDHKVQQLIKEFKLFINNNFWKCDNNTFKLLGDLYVENQLYREYLQGYSFNFPEFVKEAINIYVGDELNEEN